MNSFIHRVQAAIRPLQDQLINHELYSRVQSPEALNAFMEYHVFAVWDFMSLLKALQISLTCTTLPWIPAADAESAYLINEIVTGEETDIDEDGRRCSHFEWYLAAMEQSGSRTDAIRQFIAHIQKGLGIAEAFAATGVPTGVEPFVHHTFSIIETQKPHIMAAAFTFGREDLIPPMFIRMVETWDQSFRARFGRFIAYLERHIEVDGDTHSHLAYAMTGRLCDTEEKQEEALVAIREALEQRIRLWDAAARAIATTSYAQENS